MRLAAVLFLSAFVMLVALPTFAFQAASPPLEPGGRGGVPPAPVSSLELKLGPVNVRLIELGKRLPIDLPTALALAGARNLDLLDAREGVAEARALADRSLGRMLPETYGKLLFFGQRTSGQTQGLFSDTGRPLDRTNPAGGFELALNPAQALFHVLAARRILGAARNQSVEVSQSVLARTAIGYFSLERAQAAVRIAEQALAASRELARVAQDRESLGSGLKVDVLKAKARVAGDRIRLSRAGAAMRRASVELTLTLKLDPTLTLFPLDGVVRPMTLIDRRVSLAALLTHAVGSHPAIRGEDQRVRAAEHTRTAAWAEILGPTFYSGVQHNDIGDRGNREFYVGSVGLRFSFGSVGTARAASARLRRERIKLDRTLQHVRAAVITAYDQVTTAAEQISAARAGLEAARASLALSQTRFRNGVGIGLEVLDSEATLSEARTNLVTAIVTYNAAQVKLLEAVGAVSPMALLAIRPFTP